MKTSDPSFRLPIIYAPNAPPFQLLTITDGMNSTCTDSRLRDFVKPSKTARAICREWSERRRRRLLKKITWHALLQALRLICNESNAMQRLSARIYRL